MLMSMPVLDKGETVMLMVYVGVNALPSLSSPRSRFDFLFFPPLGLAPQ